MSKMPQFAWSSRVLHWLMAVALLAMLAIGMAMVASLESYRHLVAIHRPLGILILVLAVIRIVNRQLKPLPPFLATMSARERVIATASERLLYGLMLLLPLVGWGMLSAARLPVRVGPVVLPPILPHSMALYTLLRRAHTALAYLLFFAFMAHLSAVLFHTLALRDGLLRRMLPWTPRERGTDDTVGE
ncbi:MAG TPA: cytochrome b/b6 domain-containing protein [Polyangiaceae bacterium]|nr:cytochrome b/b6 domain-containing protein [Polyangiaceae bacterium]